MPKPLRPALLCLFLLLTNVLPATAAEVDFAHDVLPVLKAKCAQCHSAGTYKGGFSLDTRATILKSDVVTLGNAAKSKLIERVTSKDPKHRMPKQGQPLSAKDIAALSGWIDAKLPWEAGFSFSSRKQRRPLGLTRPKLPAAVQGRTNPLDRITDAYFADRKIVFPSLADDATFCRRVHLDIVGLLPTAADLQTFLTDGGSDKRQRLTRKLLASNRRYAEHWLTFWNDLLRNDYVGTGFIDGGRKQITGWLYKALLRNEPYDRFTRALVSPTPESEGFIRGIKWRGRVNASQVREIQFAQNVAQVFLGINLKCASCHDSFIDGWTLEDSYGLAAVVSDRPLEIHRCDKPTGRQAKATFLYPELGTLDPTLPRKQRLVRVAELLTKKENGRFARTIVNRIWHRLMGRAIVHPVDVMDNDAFSPQLLDYLAGHLVDNGYDLKKTIELIVTSRIYQSRTITLAEAPPAEGFVFHGPIAKRMTAEQFLDGIWRITGTAPGKTAVNVGDREGEAVRAAIVVADPLMRSLGRPNRELVVSTRPDDLSTLQALNLSNGRIFAGLLNRGAGNLKKSHPNWSATQLTQSIFLNAIGREPTETEAAIGLELLGNTISSQGTTDLLWAVFMLPEFQMIR
jgi:cytochrome c553